MQLREIIEAEKTVSNYGDWKSGPIPKSDFPLRRSKLSQSHEWSWCTVNFSALQQNFIVLIRLNEEKQEYYAYLGHMRADGMAVICSHDLHVSHKNWHCHFIQGDITRVGTGFLRDRDHMIYHPSGGSEIKCTTTFEVNKSNALTFAAERFRFNLPPQGELSI